MCSRTFYFWYIRLKITFMKSLLLTFALLFLFTEAQAQLFKHRKIQYQRVELKGLFHPQEKKDPIQKFEHVSAATKPVGALAFSEDSTSCDILTLVSGEVMEAKVIEFIYNKVRVKLCDDLNRPTQLIDKERVVSIEYADGRIEKFKEKKEAPKTIPEEDPCDTIVLINGDKIIAHFDGMDEQVVNYTLCNRKRATKVTSPKEVIEEIRLFDGARLPVTPKKQEPKLLVIEKPVLDTVISKPVLSDQAQKSEPTKRQKQVSKRQRQTGVGLGILGTLPLIPSMAILAWSYFYDSGTFLIESFMGGTAAFGFLLALILAASGLRRARWHRDRHPGIFDFTKAITIVSTVFFIVALASTVVFLALYGF